jgi:prephenate dehydrogenase
MKIRQFTIIGTGLIGGSFALALKKRKFAGKIVGCDRAAVLRQARKKDVIDEGYTDPAEAVRGSQVVLLASPVGTIIEMIERLGPARPPHLANKPATDFWPGTPWPGRNSLEWKAPILTCFRAPSGW